ncbi:hypothetical protein [Mucilaginibacter psychrotolerans]|uniref:Uncharacterized protein n=1 Tax=Mucilaginibacter psychrotolerans TaxID=1524096 RepID=A0A4Y8SLN4_9SPHI|nr:hypothetical protein [Mucilaginibacter psychrotolerans]TFF39276.1 hypothetical protein E2R66_06560 [Mucilaginibacter psychrotolerans]
MKKVDLMKVINLILLSFFIQSSKAQNLRRDSSIHLDIEFGEHFKKDKVDLFINDSLIFKNAILTSNKYYGLTYVWVTVEKKNGRYFISTSETKTSYPITIDSEVGKINLRYHGKLKKFEIKSVRGKYVVFNTGRHSEITCTQTVRPPLFD